jgi:hypothetical protein
MDGKSFLTLPQLAVSLFAMMRTFCIVILSRKSDRCAGALGLRHAELEDVEFNLLSEHPRLICFFTMVVIGAVLTGYQASTLASLTAFSFSGSIGRRKV